MPRKLFISVLIGLVIFSSLACRLTVDVPIDKVTTGPSQDEAIDIPLPEDDVADLTLAFGAGKLNVEGGAHDSLVSGEAQYNVDDYKPKIVVKDEKVLLETGNLELEGIPSFNGDIENTWDLKLADYPMKLKIGAGAYEGRLDLGGLSIQSLEINDGAADMRLGFSEPNQVEMEKFTYSTGASTVRLKNLANANFAEMSFTSGAGDYHLDFSGQLQRDAQVKIESGISNLVIVVPEGTAANVVVDGGLTSINVSGSWVHSGDTYQLQGSGPTLTIQIDMNAGNLTLRTKDAEN